MVEICKYRLPCGRCDKYDTLCDLSLEQIGFIVKDKEIECDHNWILEEQEIIRQKVSYKTYRCSICGKKQMRKFEVQDNGSFDVTLWEQT